MPTKSTAFPGSTAPAPFTDPLILGPAAVLVFVSFFPRAAAAAFLAVLASAAVVQVRAGRHAGGPGRLWSPLLCTALAFAGWSLLTSAWSPAPLASLTKPLYLAAGAMGLAIVAAGTRAQDAAALRRLAQGVVLGVLIGGAVLAFETVTDQALTKFFYNTFPFLRAGLDKQVVIDNGVVGAIKENNINRRATVATLLLVPAFLSLGLTGTKPGRWAASAGVLIIAAILLRYSAHQSSQAAIVSASIAFLLGQFLPRFAMPLIAAAWCAACLLVVPMVMALHATGVHTNEQGLFFSARHRIVIWNYTAQQVQKAPLWGIGADATASVTEMKATKPEPVEKDGQFVPDAARHAHNVYLQTWYELGAVGAALLTALGLAALAAIGRATPVIQPYLLAEFAAIAGMIAFSFSLWQVWFQGAIGIGVLAMLIAQPLARPRELNGS